MEISSDLYYFKKDEWVLWIKRVFEEKVAYPFFKTFETTSEVFEGVLSLFSVSSIPCVDYHQALQEVLLEKLNSEEYRRSDSLQEEVETIRKVLNTLKSLKK